MDSNLNSMRLERAAKAKNPARLWEATQVRDFVKQAKARVGEAGWAYLSPDMREGLIARQFAMVLLSNARQEIPGQAIQILYADMLQAAGLTTD
jgi:hypothetical protein